MPKVSVLMGVFNCEKTVEKAIESIQQQTFSDWEMIICDDGSKDNTLGIVRSISQRDDRIIIINNETNHGLAYTLNQCLKYASGEYCARMDGDDMCDSTRLEKQVIFLDNHPEYGFVSTRMKRFDENGEYQIKTRGAGQSPTKRDLIFGSPFSHAAVMIRKKCYDEVKGYRDIPQIKGDEDYDLWFRLYAHGFFGYIINEPLYYFYDDRAAQKRRTFKRRLNEAWVRRSGYKMLHIPLPYRIYILKPIILGLLPNSLYVYLRRKR